MRIAIITGPDPGIIIASLRAFVTIPLNTLCVEHEPRNPDPSDTLPRGTGAEGGHLMKRIVVLNGADNVATSLAPLEVQSRIEVELDGEHRAITVLDSIPFGHKLAIRHLTPGDEVLKYGEVIGRASEAIEPGRWVHVHNVESVRGRGDLE